ncbi:hypothetical protein GCM10010270_38080 [Streptomyces violaceus]|nr:hypothetical protein GCM10010270_38080 [Streptomyces janthinus]
MSTVRPVKWLASAVEAEHMTNFDGKVKHKGKNALGLFVSVNGFSEGGRDIFKRSTSFITVDGADLVADSAGNHGEHRAPSRRSTRPATLLRRRSALQAAVEDPS